MGSLPHGYKKSLMTLTTTSHEKKAEIVIFMGYIMVVDGDLQGQRKVHHHTTPELRIGWSIEFSILEEDQVDRGGLLHAQL